jgi:nitroimidazol reductase NimA-like FMN-containing flavoprotein (pyridoxamine 5'-phosphate oxidase superfamily)
MIRRRIQLFTAPESLKVRRLRRDPRVSIVIAAPVGERERWVSVAGRTTMEPDGAHDLSARLAARYWDLDDPARADDLRARTGAPGPPERCWSEASPT